MLHVKFHKHQGWAVKNSVINAVFLFVFICHQISFYADVKAEDYIQIMSNSDMKLKWQSLYPFENKNKCKTSAPTMVYMCNQGSRGPGEAESSSGSSQQSTVSRPPPTRFASSGIGLVKESTSCETDNRKQEIKKVCISSHQCMIDSFHSAVKKIYLHALLLDESGFQIMYCFQVDIIIGRWFSSAIIHK